ncbi:BMP family ABC transporter substrate-binding protein [Mycoplasma mycoides]|uniref:BMP family ABC transporter substrate-binding protein n=1 Tax=Mycoplasma mycoides TaxID=2102 RepID=UPI0022405870|nr:BMP family ABC transporter substrate-binding protein [Mycoplasma mycoides]QVK02815.1 BMP family ABC transporter substrate-binding protein [Mycoplasma mycoides subsp. capri]QVK03632.1 BMP family ABC transporter substrate-binding protein [Mycoplasma mycoides subsp. capri]
MKKLLTVLTTFIGISGSVSMVISCKVPTFAEGILGQRVLVVTDGGNIRDKTFNESSWEGVIKYGSQIHSNFDIKNELEARQFNYKSSIGGHTKWDETKHMFINEDYEYAKQNSNNYVETPDHTIDAFRTSYNTAIYKKADALLLAGFGHLGAVDYAADRMKKAGNKTVVFLDAQYKKDNVISVIFNSELAGFNAGWDAIMWANLPKMTSLNSGEFSKEAIDASNSKTDMVLQGSATGNKYISIGMFGGITNKNAVDNYMWGLLAAMHVYNNKFAGKEIELTDNKQNKVKYKLQPVYYANLGSKAEVEKLNDVNESSWFSKGFDVGGAKKSGIVDSLIKNQADIIFPVAGPQINDVLESTGHKPYVIGVDTDQVTSVGSSKKGNETRFITSAKKNIVSASVYALNRARSLQKAIIKDKTYTSKHEKEIKDGTTLVGEQADWSISSSRKADTKWSVEKVNGSLTNAANLSVESIDYSKDKAKEIEKNLKETLLKSGETFKQYLTKTSLDKALESISKSIKDEEWETLTLSNNGIAGIKNYWEMLIQSTKK